MHENKFYNGNFFSEKLPLNYKIYIFKFFFLLAFLKKILFNISPLFYQRHGLGGHHYFFLKRTVTK